MAPAGTSFNLTWIEALPAADLWLHLIGRDGRLRGVNRVGLVEIK